MELPVGCIQIRNNVWLHKVVLHGEPTQRLLLKLRYTRFRDTCS